MSKETIVRVFRIFLLSHYTSVVVSVRKNVNSIEVYGFKWKSFRFQGNSVIGETI